MKPAGAAPAADTLPCSTRPLIASLITATRRCGAGGAPLLSCLWQPLACCCIILPRRDAARLERFVEAWEPLLPPSALAYVMESLVLPRLRLAVQGWDPLRDTVALHTWVHPWLVRAGWAGGAQGRGRAGWSVEGQAVVCKGMCCTMAAARDGAFVPRPAMWGVPNHTRMHRSAFSLPVLAHAAVPGAANGGALARHPVQVCLGAAGVAPLG